MNELMNLKAPCSLLCVCTNNMEAGGGGDAPLQLLCYCQQRSCEQPLSLLALVKAKTLGRLGTRFLGKTD